MIVDSDFCFGNRVLDGSIKRFILRRAMIVAAVVAATAVLGFSVARDQGTAKAPEADEQAIRAIVEAFTTAFDKHDAEAIAALFVPDGKMITEDGTIIEGRNAIAATFAGQFAESPNATIKVTVDSIKFIGSDLAMETGSTIMTPGPGEVPESNRYNVVHVKHDGKWLMALARDTDGESLTNHQRLDALEWLVGDWIDESPEAVVMTSCRWSPVKNFLLQDIQVIAAGQPMMTINQRIGWDALQKCLHSWVFDSEGGFGEGLWTRDGDDWLIRATGVRNDGTTALATNSLHRIGKDAYLWRSIARVLSGAVGDPSEVRIVRKPPTAAATKN